MRYNAFVLSRKQPLTALRDLRSVEENHVFTGAERGDDTYYISDSGTHCGVIGFAKNLGVNGTVEGNQIVLGVPDTADSVELLRVASRAKLAPNPTGQMFTLENIL